MSHKAPAFLGFRSTTWSHVNRATTAIRTYITYVYKYALTSTRIHPHSYTRSRTSTLTNSWGTGRMLCKHLRSKVCNKTWLNNFSSARSSGGWVVSGWQDWHGGPWLWMGIPHCQRLLQFWCCHLPRALTSCCSSSHEHLPSGHPPIINTRKEIIVSLKTKQCYILNVHSTKEVVYSYRFRLTFIFWLQKFEYAHKHIENAIESF